MSDEKPKFRNIRKGSSYMSKIKLGIIEVDTIKFEGDLVFPAIQGLAMFSKSVNDCGSIDTNRRISELSLSHLLDFEEYGDVDNMESLRQIVAAIGATKAEIDSFDQKNNEAWYIANYVVYLYKIHCARNEVGGSKYRKNGIISYSISIGRLIEWWRWRSESFEQSAISEINRKAKSSSSSAKANTDKRQQRIESLLKEMEILVGANPVLSELDPVQCGKAALKNVVKDNSTLWTQGQGQLAEYLTTLSSDQTYESRYELLFHKTT